MSSLTSDNAVINHLFNALSSVQLQEIGNNSPPTVDPETFAAFYSTWKQVRLDDVSFIEIVFASKLFNSGLIVMLDN